MIRPLMATVSNRLKSRNNKSVSWSQVFDSSWARGCFVVALVALLFVFHFSVTTRPALETSVVGEMTNPSDPMTVSSTKKAGVTSKGQLVKGFTQDGTEYYHCAARTPRDSTTRDVVLLHGAKFTKEDWKQSNILSKLCDNGKLSITALDLPVSAGGNQLNRVLQALAVEEQRIHPSGNYVVVTPSASGKSIVDWINLGDHQELMEKVGLWVPIASPAIAGANLDKLHALAAQNWSILALYGDKDVQGKQVSLLLQKEANAKLKEFPGPHAFYLDIPEEFSVFLLKVLGVR